MRFLADHDVYLLPQELRHAGHDVVTAKELQLHAAVDSELLAKAKALDCIFLSRDKDFGALIFLHALNSPGAIFLRISPRDVDAVRCSGVTERKTRLNNGRNDLFGMSGGPFGTVSLRKT